MKNYGFAAFVGIDTLIMVLVYKTNGGESDCIADCAMITAVVCYIHKAAKAEHCH